MMLVFVLFFGLSFRLDQRSSKVADFKPILYYGAWWYENFPMMPGGGLLYATSGACAATVASQQLRVGQEAAPLRLSSSCAVCRGAAVGGTWEKEEEAERQGEGLLVLLEKRL
jgi:hypothetical protein